MSCDVITVHKGFRLFFCVRAPCACASACSRECAHGSGDVLNARESRLRKMRLLNAYAVLNETDGLRFGTLILVRMHLIRSIVSFAHDV